MSQRSSVSTDAVAVAPLAGKVSPVVSEFADRNNQTVWDVICPTGSRELLIGADVPTITDGTTWSKAKPGTTWSKAKPGTTWSKAKPGTSWSVVKERELLIV